MFFRERPYIEEKLEKNGVFLEKPKKHKINCKQQKSQKTLGL
jgi:hypothetical protein